VSCRGRVMPVSRPEPRLKDFGVLGQVDVNRVVVAPYIVECSLSRSMRRATGVASALGKLKRPRFSAAPKRVAAPG
jgi:hypothetical protein